MSWSKWSLFLETAFGCLKLRKRCPGNQLRVWVGISFYLCQVSERSNLKKKDRRQLSLLQGSLISWLPHEIFLHFSKSSKVNVSICSWGKLCICIGLTSFGLLPWYKSKLLFFARYKCKLSFVAHCKCKILPCGPGVCGLSWTDVTKYASHCSLRKLCICLAFSESLPLQM